MVVKRSGQKEPYNRQKVLDGIRRAGKNRPTVIRAIDDVVAKIEHQLMRRGDSEVTSRAIGELVMNELRSLDAVAYLRFTSVCRSFEDVESFARELETLSEPSITPSGGGSS
jgi:transcriptional repressor NrdR